MQLLPKPNHNLFPDDVLDTSSPSSNGIISHPEVPYLHGLLPIPPNATSSEIFSSYQKLCQHLQIAPGSPHNVFSTDTWIIVIPRSKARAGDSDSAVNAASMLGVVWVKTEAELHAWKAYGPMKVLEEVGVKRDVSSSTGR